MFDNILKTRKFKSVTPKLYNHIVAQSRQPFFYADYNVEDDFQGRFNILSLHMILVLDRLQKEGSDGDDLNQILVDHFFDDLDGVVREMGAGDMGVSHRIKKLADRFYGRMKAYQDGLKKPDQDALKQALWRNVYPDRVDDGEADAEKLSEYTLEISRHLETVPFTSFTSGKLVFP